MVDEWENSLQKASLGGSDTAWVDKLETGTNSLRKASLRGSDSAWWTDRKTVQIAWGKLRWEDAKQHGGRIGTRANSLRKASLGGIDAAWWTDWKPCN